MTDHTPYLVYLNNQTGDLWDPRTGELLLRQSTSAKVTRFFRILRRYLIWLAVILSSGIPAFVRW